MEKADEEALIRRLNVAGVALCLEINRIMRQFEAKIWESSPLEQIEMLEAITTEMVPVLYRIADRFRVR